MNTTGLGSVLLEISLDSMAQADVNRVERVVLLLKQPNDKLIEVPVPADGVDRPGKLAAALHTVEARGQYKLGAKLFFHGGTWITAHNSEIFNATDGMT